MTLFFSPLFGSAIWIGGGGAGLLLVIIIVMLLLR
jgi:cellobiose-specific phosphotransferase system component IIC